MTVLEASYHFVRDLVLSTRYQYTSSIDITRRTSRRQKIHSYLFLIALYVYPYQEKYYLPAIHL